MSLEIEAVYESGVLKPDQPLPLHDSERVRVTVHVPTRAPRKGFGLVPWTGSVEELDYLIYDVENDPLEPA